MVRVRGVCQICQICQICHRSIGLTGRRADSMGILMTIVYSNIVLNVAPMPMPNHIYKRRRKKETNPQTDTRAGSCTNISIFSFIYGSSELLKCKTLFVSSNALSSPLETSNKEQPASPLIQPASPLISPWSRRIATVRRPTPPVLIHV